MNVELVNLGKSGDAMSISPCVSRLSPCLRGTSTGARLNRILTEYSMSSLIICGNHRLYHGSNHFDLGTDNCAVCICTNKMHFQKMYFGISNTYKAAYAEWMDRAVSSFIQYVDNIRGPCVLFRNTCNTADLFFDISLCGGADLSKEKRIRVRAAPVKGADDMYEFVLDTVHHDMGVTF